MNRVNPGRKASLSGIREGDVISSINGRPTRGMSSADAHALLRTAGPVLRLGLNEDKELSPRRRSIGKAAELKRPSQLLAEVSQATPQAPVYATIRPAPAPHSKQTSSPADQTTSAPSAPSAPPAIHPTNPFYTTLPSSTSRLPVPNGRPTFSTIDRTKKENSDYSDLKSPSLFTSSPYFHHNESVNGTEAKKNDDATDPFSYTKFNYDNQRLPNNVNEKNPFETKRNSDPFEKYLRQDNLNGQSEFETKNNIPGSQSENNFTRREEITKTSMITEHKINEVEEVRTIKKIVLNGCGDSDRPLESQKFSSPSRNGTHEFDFERFRNDQKNSFSAPVNDTGRTKFDYSQSQSKERQQNSQRSPIQRSPIQPYSVREEYYSSIFPRPSLSSLTSSSKCSAWTTLTNEHRAAFRSAGERTGVKFRSA
ncbi:PDZ domain (Also known as DHR or GLGF) domain-containing protein [Phthorimaea operculella]|nr:PDZ domain (Also known as DHR or GLGF) domain-containing protein [Phthorimaea operculella]